MKYPRESKSRRTRSLPFSHIRVIFGGTAVALRSALLSIRNTTALFLYPAWPCWVYFSSYFNSPLITCFTSRHFFFSARTFFPFCSLSRFSFSFLARKASFFFSASLCASAHSVCHFAWFLSSFSDDCFPKSTIWNLKTASWSSSR